MRLLRLLRKNVGAPWDLLEIPETANVRKESFSSTECQVRFTHSFVRYPRDLSNPVVTRLRNVTFNWYFVANVVDKKSQMNFQLSIKESQIPSPYLVEAVKLLTYSKLPLQK